MFRSFLVGLSIGDLGDSEHHAFEITLAANTSQVHMDSKRKGLFVDVTAGLGVGSIGL